METDNSSGNLRLIASTILITIGIVGSYIYSYNKLYKSIDLSFADVKTIEYGEANYKIDQLIDKVDGDEIVVKKDIDPSVVGKQKVVLEVKIDEVVKEFTYEVEVQDTRAPDISIKEETITLCEGTEYNILDNIASVNDSVDGDLEFKENEEGTEYYTYTTNLDTNTPGTYDINITAVDKYNNVSQITYKVIVEQKPVVTTKETTTTTTTTDTSEKDYSYNNDYVSQIDTSSISSIAYSLIGSPYRSGGTTPAGFDCSGFVQYVYSQMGISISRSSKTQAYDGYAVSVDSMQAGDIIVWSSNGSTPTHTAIYVGNGIMIHATNPTQGVIASNVWAWNSGSSDSIIAVRRI